MEIVTKKVSFEEDAIDKATKMIIEASQILQPNLQGLSVLQRRRLFKMSKKSLAFVKDSSSWTKTNPEFIPAFTDASVIQNDVKAYEMLKPVFDVLSTFYSDVADTLMLCGSDALAEARVYYNSVSYAAKRGNKAAKPIAEELSRRFAKAGKLPPGEPGKEDK